MSNANTNLVSIPIRPTNATNSTSRSNQATRSPRATSNTKNSKSTNSARSSKGNFGAELDKANAQANQAQPDEVQSATQAAESAPVDAIAKTPSQGQNNKQQDAPQGKFPNQPQNENSQPVTENVADDVTQTISPTIQPQVQIELPIDVAQNIPQDIPQNVNAEIVTEDVAPQIVPTVAAEIPIDADKNISVKPKTENLTPTISSDIPADNLKADENVTDEVELPSGEEIAPTLASSADMMFYFTDNTEKLLTTNVPVEVEQTNLMSIMPQARDDKAQSMLDLLSGKTWQSVKSTDNLPQQNINLQNLSPQSELPAQNLNQNIFPIQPQFQPRPLNIQPTLQVQPPTDIPQQSEIQPTLQVQTSTLPTDFQPNLNQVQPQVQASTLPNDFQPNLNQVQSQVQTSTLPTDFQPNLNQVQSQVQASTLPTDFQPNLNQVQPQVQASTLPNDFQSNLNQVQPQVQASTLPTDFQPNLNQVQPQVQASTLPTDFQPNLNQVQPQVQTSTLPTDFQPNLNQVQPQVQASTLPTDFQTNLHQVQPQVQASTLPTDFQTNLHQVQPQVQNSQQVEIQPTLQAQQQQFGGQIQPQINSLQPQLDSRTVTRQTVDEFLGVQVQFEASRPSTPIMPLQSTPQQFEQNQQSARDFQQNFSQLTPDVETQNHEQLPTGAENFAGNVATVNQPQNQPAAQVQAPEVMQAPQEDYNVPAQIVEQARMIRTATNTEMVINLKPEHLGELTLRVSVSTNGAVNASFYSDNAQVRAIIENSIVQLRQELNEQGIKVDNVEVYAGLSEDGLLNGQGQQAWQQNQQRGRRGTINVEAVEEEVDVLNPINENVSADGVDYKV